MSGLVTYEPDNSTKGGYSSLCKEIMIDISANRWLTYQLFRRDFLAAYKQTVIGALWSIFIPLISVGMFILLNNAGIINVGNTHTPYPIYATLGLIFWQVFSSGVMASSNSLVNAGSMIVKINCSKKSFVIASIGQSMLSFFIQLILLGILFATYRITPQLTIIFFPLLIIPVVTLVLALGFVLSLLNGVIRDVGSILSVLLSFLMLLTPVFYVKPLTGLLADISRINPLYYLVSVPRDIILTGFTVEWTGYILSVCMSIMALVVSILIFHLTETRVAERI
jgi:lipopolysaccharide transport system permease protein